MTSSSYCELVLRQDGVEVFSAPVAPESIPLSSDANPKLQANRSIELTLRRGVSTDLLRVMLESEELWSMTPDRREWTLQLGEALRDQFGRATLVIESARGRVPSTLPSAWNRILTVHLTIEAEPSFKRLHEALVTELEDVDIALARDVTSRTWHEGTDSSGPGGRGLRVENDLDRLRDIFDRLSVALNLISKQPTRTLRRHRSIERWRPGDVVGAAAIQRMASAGDLRRGRSGRMTLPSKILKERAQLATDIEEHRHIRAGILRLADRSASIARYCGRAISLLQEDEGRWSEEALRQKIEPKVYSLALARETAHDLQGRIRRLADEHSFIAEASATRTPFGPTPLFLGKRAYRQIYRALLEARRCAGGRYESDGMRVRFRNLATLYEYWLFVRVVGMLGELYGPPSNTGGFALIDEFYRPELAPGQQFRFRLPHGDTLTATYEPDFPPVTAKSRLRFRSALVTAPLRPDVTLELNMPGRPPCILALDAKSGPRFRREKERLIASSTYLTLIHDPMTGHQPVRQLFLVHRDMGTEAFSNLTGYLEGRVSPPDARALGAVPAQPGDVNALRNVVLRFLETFRARKWR